MLFETLSQPTIFVWLMFGGFCSGVFFDLKNIFSYFLKKKRFFKQFFMFFSCFFTLIVFFVINLKVNYGQFRFFTFATFIIAFSIERFLSENALANFVTKWYNAIKEKQNEKRTRRNASKQKEI